MAIDKNSKAYQNLLNSGYSDQQITDMYNKASSGQSRQEVVANTQPVNTPTTQPTTPAAQPTAQPTEQPTQPTPEVRQETVVKQQETVGSTVPEIKQEGELKPLSQDYYNQTGDEAMKQIRDNLNDYKRTNPEYFTDYESFKKNFSYDTRNTEQKNTLDQWYKGYEQGLQLSGMTVNDLYNQYNSGQISDTQLQSLRVENPNKYAELQNQINKGNIIAAYDDDKGDATNMSFQDMAYQMMQKTFMQFMNGGSDSGATQFFAEYKVNLNSPEMVRLSDESAELQEQIENVQSDIANMKKAVEKEYEGTGATRSKINAIISDRTYELQTQLQTLDSQYKRVATQYNNRMQQYSNDFELQLQEYQLGMQERNQKMDELGFAMNLMSFETPQQQQERQWNYWVMQQEYENGNINSKDYQTRYKAALKSVQNLLSQYEGIPMQRSSEQMAQDILTAIDNGSDLGAELTKINKLIQEKPEYKKLYNQTFGTSQGFGNMVSIGGQDYVEYDGKLYTADEFNKKYGGAKSTANYNVVSEDVLKTYPDGRAGTFGSFMANSKYNDDNYIGQCGKFVNNYLQEIGAGRLFGNEDIKTREDWINSDEGKVGTIAVFDYGHKSSDGINHGHVGIVISGPDKDGNILVKDANFGSDGKIQTREVNLKDASLKGFIDPSLDQNGNRVSAGTSATLTSNNSNTNSNTVIAGGLTQAGIEQEAKNMIDGKKSYSEIKAAYGDEALKQIELRMLDLTNQGYTPDTKITDPTRLQTAENNALKQYQSITEDAQQILDFVDQMETAWALIDTNRGSAEQLLITTYNKISDPKSIVRESEFNRTAEGQSLMNELRGKLGKLNEGGAGITKQELSKYMNVARELGKNAEAKIEKEAGRMKIVIDKYGYSPEYVLGYDMTDKLYNKVEEVNDLTNGMPLTGGSYGGGTAITTGGFNISSNWNNAQ